MERVKIVVAEDEPAVRAAITMVLERSGHFILAGIAADGEEAIRVCSELAPEVVLLDLNLPKFNGLQVAHRLLAHDPKIKIIVLSGFLRKDVVQSARQIGVLDLIQKPVRGPELVGRILAVCRGQPNASEPTPVGGMPPIPDPGQAPLMRSPRPAGLMNLLGVTGARTGMGATSFATNLATLLHERKGRRVLLVDSDLTFSDASYIFRGGAQDRLTSLIEDGIEDGPDRVGGSLAALDEGDPDNQTTLSLVDVFKNGWTRDLEMLQSVIFRTQIGIDLLRGPAEPCLSPTAEVHLMAILETLETQYEHIVIDLPAILTRGRVTLLNSLDRVFFLVKNDVQSVRYTRTFLSSLQNSNFAMEKLDVIENRFAAPMGLSSGDFSHSIGIPILAHLEDDHPGMRESYLIRSPLVSIQNSELVETLERFVDRHFANDLEEVFIPMELDD